jgi:hypothetical protein
MIGSVSGTRVFKIVPPQLLISGMAQRFLYRTVPSSPIMDVPLLRYDSAMIGGSLFLEFFDGF